MLKGEFFLMGVPDEQINGCGSKGFGRFVRDKWGSVDFRKAGQIHDSEYYWLAKKNNPAVRNALRKAADDRFLYNMEILNDKYSKTTFGRYARLPVIYSYYAAVRLFGGFFV